MKQVSLENAPRVLGRLVGREITEAEMVDVSGGIWDDTKGSAVRGTAIFVRGKAVEYDSYDTDAPL